MQIMCHLRRARPFLGVLSATRRSCSNLSSTAAAAVAAHEQPHLGHTFQRQGMQTGLPACYSLLKQQPATLWLSISACHGLQPGHPKRFRHFTTDDLRIQHSALTEAEYHKAADDTLEELQEVLEGFLEDLSLPDGDVEYSQGVLTVRLGKHGTYVINKQTPNRQIWLSSPVSGPSRFDWHNRSWTYHRTGQELLHLLQNELQQLLGQAPDL